MKKNATILFGSCDTIIDFTQDEPGGVNIDDILSQL